MGDIGEADIRALRERIDQLERRYERDRGHDCSDRDFDRRSRELWDRTIASGFLWLSGGVSLMFLVLAFLR